MEAPCGRKLPVKRTEMLWGRHRSRQGSAMPITRTEMLWGRVKAKRQVEGTNCEQGTLSHSEEKSDDLGGAVDWEEDEVEERGILMEEGTESEEDDAEDSKEAEDYEGAEQQSCESPDYLFFVEDDIVEAAERSPEAGTSSGVRNVEDVPESGAVLPPETAETGPSSGVRKVEDVPESCAVLPPETAEAGPSSGVHRQGEYVPESGAVLPPENAKAGPSSGVHRQAENFQATAAVFPPETVPRVLSKFEKTLERSLDELGNGLPGVTNVDDRYIRQAFCQIFHLQKGIKMENAIDPIPLFVHQAWNNAECEKAWKKWEPWRNARERLRKDYGKYNHYEKGCNLAGFLHSTLKNLFPEKLDKDPTFDYGMLMEVVRTMNLEYENEPYLTIVNVEDCLNRIGLVMADVRRGKPLLVQSILGEASIQMKDGTEAFRVQSGQIISNDDIERFNGVFGEAQRKKFSGMTSGANIVYVRIDNYKEQGRQKDFNQHRILYSYLALAVRILKKDGSVVFNCSHMGLDGFFIGNMHLLCQLFSDVCVMKPVASLDSSFDIVIVAKGYAPPSNNLNHEILRGNETNIGMIYNQRCFPLGATEIPRAFIATAVQAGQKRFTWMMKHNQRNLYLFKNRDEEDNRRLKLRYKIATVHKWLCEIRVEDYVYGVPAASLRPV